VIKIWGEADLESLDLIHREVILDKDLNPALRADFLRLELLYKFGGLYSDVDMTCEKNVFEELQVRFNTPKISFVTGVSNTQAFEVNNGIMLGKPGSAFTRYLIEKLGENIKKERKAVVASTVKENQLIQMLSLVDPAKAAQMKRSSQVHQLNVIKTSGPGFVTQAIFAYLNFHAQIPVNQSN
jgi:mannosyltransferase OCH1-like enzyme